MIVSVARLTFESWRSMLAKSVKILFSHIGHEKLNDIASIANFDLRRTMSGRDSVIPIGTDHMVSLRHSPSCVPVNTASAKL